MSVMLKMSRSRKNRLMTWAAVPVISLAVLNGCFVYVPVEISAPNEGADVRVRLMPSQEYEIGELRVRDVTSVDGVMFGTANDSVAIWSQWMYTAAGNRYWSDHQVVYFDPTELRTFEERKWHPARTIVALGVGAGLGLGLMRFTLLVTGEGANKNPPPITASFVPAAPMSR